MRDDIDFVNFLNNLYKYSRKKQLTFKEICKLLNWNILTNKKDIPIEYIVKDNKYTEYWNIDILSKRDDLTWDIIIDSNINIDSNDNFYTVKWDYNLLSCKDDINWEFVHLYFNKNWNWYILSGHKDLTHDVINKYINLPWNYDILISNNNVKWKDIQDNNHKNKYIEAYKSKIHNFKNFTVNWDFICNNLYLNWNWICLSLNTTLTNEIIQKYNDCPWKHQILLDREII
jgi:hypothetical protein